MGINPNPNLNTPNRNSLTNVEFIRVIGQNKSFETIHSEIMK